MVDVTSRTARRCTRPPRTSTRPSARMPSASRRWSACSRTCGRRRRTGSLLAERAARGRTAFRRPHADAPACAGRTAAPPVAVTRPGAAPSSGLTLARATHAQSLEIVVTGRADDHGGPEFFERLVAAAAHNHALLDAPASPTLHARRVEPVPGRRPLAERSPSGCRSGTGPTSSSRPGTGDLTNPRLQFMEFFAKNVAVRRSTADAILTTNSDVFLSEALVSRLAAAPIADEHVYRAVRPTSIAIATGAVAASGSWPIRGITSGSIGSPRRNSRTPPATSCCSRQRRGGACAASTSRPLRKIHKDGQFCPAPGSRACRSTSSARSGTSITRARDSNVGVLRGAPGAPYRPEWNWRDHYRNGPTGGSAVAVEVPAGGPVVWLRPHRLDAGAAATARGVGIVRGGRAGARRGPARRARRRPRRPGRVAGRPRPR